MGDAAHLGGRFSGGTVSRGSGAAAPRHRLILAIVPAALVLSSPLGVAAELLAGLKDGQEVVNLVRSQRPTENSAINGLLKTRDAEGKRREVPVKITTLAGEDTWRILYEVLGSDHQTVERLTVLRADDQPPRYEHHQLVGPSSSAAAPTSLDGDHAMVPFADTDFWLADLGLQFLWWPEHRVVPDAKITMRKSIACKVLDSVNPKAGDSGYARVRSWVAIENGGLVYAEAYDRRNKLLKVFEISNVEKVNGRWELKELKIRNEQTDSVTRLEFNLQVQSP